MRRHCALRTAEVEEIESKLAETEVVGEDAKQEAEDLMAETERTPNILHITLREMDRGRPQPRLGRTQEPCIPAEEQEQDRLHTNMRMTVAHTSDRITGMGAGAIMVAETERL